jgi:hypothetical protein
MTSQVTLSAQGCYEITQLNAAEVFETDSDVSSASIFIASHDLTAALWAPNLLESPTSHEPWGAMAWAFQIFDGSTGLLTNDDAGGDRWNLWVTDTADTADLLEALLAVIAERGFQAGCRMDDSKHVPPR